MHLPRESPSGLVGIAVSVAASCMLVAGGCDPVINIGGANFPGWLLCAIIGIVLAALLQQLFAIVGIEAYMGPMILIFPCLVVLIGCIFWMIFFNRV